MPPAVSARHKTGPTRLKPISAVGVVAIVALIALTLLWFRFGDKATDNHPELQGPGKIAHNPSDVPTSRAPETSGDFEVADLNTTPSNVVAPIPMDLASNREPEPRPSVYRSLPTGTRLMEDTGTAGNGVLGVQNGTPEDAVVRLYDQSSEATIRWFYVKAHESARIRGIPEGIYGIRYTTGLDWQDGDDAFRWQPAYSQFERQFVYAEQWVGAALHYTEIRITLQPVIGGTVGTISISREDFLRGHRHASVQR